MIRDVILWKHQNTNSFPTDISRLTTVRPVFKKMTENFKNRQCATENSSTGN